MAKKSLICGLAIVILSLCCGMCFAADNGNSINLGNEVMESIDKTEDSVKNVVSGNIVGETTNTVKDGVNNVDSGINNVENGVENDNDNNTNKVTAGNYNTVRTTTEGTTTNSGTNNTMTATTWMWIILIVAAVIIIAAIWYYATQNNS